MSVTIGHASLDENKQVKGGAAGDQTKKEVCTRSWYSKPWTCVIRPKYGKAAEAIAKAMEQACANDNIGYDQSQRTTLYDQAKALNWDISKITTTCECDCSSLVAVCVNAAGITVNKSMYTGNEKTALANTGAFTIYTDSKYIDMAKSLKRGDILLGNGHTAVVLTNGANADVAENATTQPNTNSNASSNATVTVTSSVKATDSARNYLATLAGTYKVTAALLNVRHGAGITKKIMVVIPKDTQVKCYGYYTAVSGTNWLYVQFTYKGKQYTGFASSNCLRK